MLPAVRRAGLPIFLWAGAFAQTQVFEAATVKPSNPSLGARAFPKMTGGPGTADPQRLSVTAYTLDGLLRLAYTIPYNGAKASDQISGPSWLDSDKFDIVATIRSGATQEQTKQMLQSLLVERFGLKVHFETRLVPGYELTVSKGGEKLRPAEDPDAMPPVVGKPLPAERVENSYPVIPPGLKAMRWFVVDNGLMHGTGRSQSIPDLIRGVIATYLRFDAKSIALD